MDETEVKINKLRMDSEYYKQKSDQLEQDLSIYIEQSTELAETNHKQLDRIIELEKENDGLTNSLVEVSLKLTETKKEADQIEARMEETKEAYDNLRELYNGKIAELDRKCLELDELKQTNEHNKEMLKLTLPIRLRNDNKDLEIDALKDELENARTQIERMTVEAESTPALFAKKLVSRKFLVCVFGMLGSFVISMNADATKTSLTYNIMAMLTYALVAGIYIAVEGFRDAINTQNEPLLKDKQEDNKDGIEN